MASSPTIHFQQQSDKKKTFSLNTQLIRDHLVQGLYPEMEAVLKIVEIMLVFSVSTASVERGFSTLNLIVTILRGQLSQGSKEKLMHISSTSPAMKDFDPEIILQFWKQLSMSEEKISLFDYAIPSIYTVNQNEMQNPKKNL